MIVIFKLDYTIESPEERKALVEQIIAETPESSLSPQYLEILADYLILCMEKQERRRKKILTENRETTINKRETSYEELADKLEGEDNIFNLINNNTKQTIFQPKISITQDDLNTIPPLRQLRETINTWTAALAHTKGKDAYTMKRAIIQMRKDQYLIKQAYKKPISFTHITPKSQFYPSLDDKSFYNKEIRDVQIEGISLMNPKVIAALLKNYSKLKEDTYDQFSGDVWYLIQSLEDLATRALSPLLFRIVELKVDGKENAEIQKTLIQEFGITYSLVYLSSLWTNKIPKTIAAQAKEDYLIQYYKEHNLPLKRCSKCGKWKPAHNQFFSKNKVSSDGLYSVCKKCRNSKRNEVKKK